MAKAFSIKKGNWYICVKSAHNHNGGVAFTKDKIYHSPKDECLVRDDNGQPEIIGAFLMEHFRPWTVKDAKPGDFLTYTTENGEDWYFIFKSEYKPYDGMYHYYAGFTKEFIPGDTGCLDEDGFRPSTPEEKELLLSKIQENGYVWDVENCKLINTNKNPESECQRPRHYKVITLCGSTRFKEQFLQQQKRLTLGGNIVLTVGLFGHSGDEEVWKPGAKEMLDDMHLRKIDFSDEIFVINVGGYIGESTRREIAYAESKGKIIKYLED